jgi:hypothetical protein
MPASRCSDMIFFQVSVPPFRMTFFPDLAPCETEDASAYTDGDQSEFRS